MLHCGGKGGGGGGGRGVGGWQCLPLHSQTTGGLFFYKSKPHLTDVTISSLESEAESQTAAANSTIWPETRQDGF